MTAQTGSPSGRSAQSKSPAGPLPPDIIKPEIRQDPSGIRHMKPGTPFRQIHRLLEQGADLCLDHSFGFAMSFYSWLKKHLAARHPAMDYQSEKRQREIRHRCQSSLWMGVRNGVPIMEKAPHNPWLKEFYPGQELYYLRFTDFLGMNGARQWFEKGLSLASIEFRLHPFYGVYFPRRESHLVLFDQWLSAQAPFERAADIGTGCGILSFIMQKHGIGHIHATDINPNAIYSLQQELSRHGQKKHLTIIPELADLTGSFRPQTGDLLVCNPPWIPAGIRHTLDLATYYEAGFFQRLFGHLRDKCPAGSTIALLFSDFAIQAGIIDQHPIEVALDQFRDDFSLREVLQRPVIEQGSKATGWLSRLREKEKTALYIIGRV